MSCTCGKTSTSRPAPTPSCEARQPRKPGLQLRLRSDEAMLTGLGTDHDRTDAAAIAALKNEMATEEQVEQGHLAAADDEVRGEPSSRLFV